MWVLPVAVLPASAAGIVGPVGALNTSEYAGYVALQVGANVRKLARRSFVPREDLTSLAKWVNQHVELSPDSRFGICHGTRRGSEQLWLTEALGWPNGAVIGTEIAPSARRFPFTVQHDFHDERPEWKGRATFVYSNALDHAYNPAKAIGAWLRSLRSNGVILLEHTDKNHNGNKGGGADVFQSSFGGYIKLIASIDQAEVVDVLPCATRPACRHIVIRQAQQPLLSSVGYTNGYEKEAQRLGRLPRASSLR